ncbi:uroporphyrinogen-III C-methyltransferase [Shouchella sp. JSM 1781072]|uniref:uroporphyrinogen-III C-methyltransferase n=1 Tax=Shouchella sp. JSM 1781072 TaxID=3344581 RepID=UPI0035C11B40
MAKGTVSLVGAGPGDIGLISYKGMQRLRQADVVLYDRLVNPLLLEEAKEGANLIYVGKLPNRHVFRQEAIHDELVRQAESHQVVVRLKGGDPSVFGRVGEEASFLENYHVPYEIIPGVTSGIAAPAYANVPVTHRTKGTSFAVATGHSQKENSLELDWEGLSKIDTVAFYMGVKNLPNIVDQFQQHGRAADEPVLCIQWGTTSKQRVVKATLSTIVEAVQKHGIGNPAITLVGDVAALYEGKSWFEQKPLFGHYPLILSQSGSQLVEQLREAGAEAYQPKVVRKQGLNLANLLNEGDSLVFQAEQDVHAFFQQLIAEKMDVRSLKVNVVSETSEATEALRHYGFFQLLTEPVGEVFTYAANERDQVEWTATSDIILNRLKEEESITDVFVSTVEELQILDRLLDDYPALRNLPIYSYSHNVVCELEKRALRGLLIDSHAQSRLGQWLHDWQGQVNQHASHSLCRSR